MPVAELLTNASQSNLAVSHFAISRKSVSNVLEVYLQNSTQPHNPPKAQNKPSTNPMKTNISQNHPQEKINIEHVPNQHSHTSQSRRQTRIFFLEQHPLRPKKPQTKTTIAPTFSQEALHQTPRNTTSFPSVKKSEKSAISKSAIQTS